MLNERYLELGLHIVKDIDLRAETEGFDASQRVALGLTAFCGFLGEHCGKAGCVELLRDCADWIERDLLASPRPW